MHCWARVEKEKVFYIEGLSSEPVEVDIHSEILGQLTWIYTDETTFSIKVKIFAQNETHLKSTGLNLSTTNSSVNLSIGENHFPYAPAPVTGSGNAINVPTFLVCCLPWLIGWNNPMAFLLTVLANSFLPGYAEETFSVARKNVEVEVKAPRRLVYNTINLYVNGGKLRLVDKVAVGDILPTCKTDLASEGCSNCCHGHGVCTLNKCLCDEEYDPDSHCAAKKRHTIFFSHPLDPRYERTRLPNTDVLTLGKVFQFVQEPPYLKDPDVYAMEIRSRDLRFPQILILFHADGFIEEITDIKTFERSVIKLRRAKLHKCFIRLRGQNLNLEVNICDDIYPPKVPSTGENQRIPNDNKENEITLQTGNEYEDKRRHRRKKQKIKSHFYHNSIDFPVRIERCGYNSSDIKSVYFKLIKRTLKH